MVKLSDAFKTKEVELSNLPESKIVVKLWLSVFETSSALEKFPETGSWNNKQANEASLYMVRLWIVSWNLEDDNWKVLEITDENIKKLPSEDFNRLASIIMWLDKKKI